MHWLMWSICGLSLSIILARANRHAQFLAAMPFIIVFSFILMFQDGVGSDYYAYMGFASDLSIERFLERGEIASYISLLLAKNFDFPRLYYFVNGLIFGFAVLFTCEQIKGQNKFYVVFLLIILASPCLFSVFNTVRQSVAGAFTAIALVYITNGKRWQFLLFVLLASLFHIGAILLLPLFIFKNQLKYWSSLKVFFALTVIMFVSWQLVEDFLLRRFPYYSLYLINKKDLEWIPLLTKFYPIICLTIFSGFSFKFFKQFLESNYSKLYLITISPIVLAIILQNFYVVRYYEYFSLLLLSPFLFLLENSRNSLTRIGIFISAILPMVYKLLQLDTQEYTYFYKLTYGV